MSWLDVLVGLAGCLVGWSLRGAVERWFRLRPEPATLTAPLPDPLTLTSPTTRPPYQRQDGYGSRLWDTQRI